MESSGEKKHPPSRLRLDRLRRDGTVAVSRDLTSSFVLAAGVGALCVAAQNALGKLLAFTCDVFSVVPRPGDTPRNVMPLLRDAGVLVATACAPVAIAALVVGLLVARAQSGSVFSLRTLVPKLGSLNPLSGLVRIGFSKQAWLSHLQTLLKLTLLVVLCVQAVQAALPSIVACVGCDLGSAVAVARSASGRLVLHAAGAFCVLGVLDYVRQRWSFARQHSMSDYELRKEYEDDEGKPEVKAARKHLMRELLERRAMQRTATADLLTINPTHIACAIVIDKQRDVPRLVAKGEGALAEAMKELARVRGIPIRAEIPLTRAIFQLEEGQMVPETLWVTLKVVFDWAAEVLRARGKTPHWEKSPDDATPPSERR